MRATMKYGIRGLEGKLDGLVYYTIAGKDIMIARRLPRYFEPTQQHTDYADINHNLRKIKPCQAYKDDFKMYFGLYRSLPEANQNSVQWYNLYIAMMWDMQKAGLVDLKVITRQLIYDNNLPCISVKAAVEAGLLPEVTNYQMLSNTI